ncbi:class I SAM-dependent methyltransferase [Acinetobacter sp. MD2(2019)]|uniref:class I SAM-dependent methyltransferase n=1 Tax=Acinetobacter sp. MD2(2019) TaxID=2605273 RepID=UPI002D1F755C|nr:class I SAM-dependent methyltransferase [Acinetobacter sp. MD2(2019)]MEB3754838.1 class I SAM-dependent methyltransferase [Acinetobacter sp. MD2(2019)]
MTNQQNISQKQYQDKSDAYLKSQVHAQGAEFEKMRQCIQAHQFKQILDLGCGGGHVSYQVADLTERTIAYDVTPEMLSVVEKEAQQRGLTQIQTQLGMAEKLPFADASFDCVISRYSAHHWQHVGQAMQEIYRILAHNGKVILVDILGNAQPALDTFLQTIEMIRDPSHVRDYSLSEWMHFAEYSGFRVEQMQKQSLSLDFESWVSRMKTPENQVKTIRALQASVADNVKDYFHIQKDGSFQTEVMYLVLSKAA